MRHPVEEVGLLASGECRRGARRDINNRAKRPETSGHCVEERPRELMDRAHAEVSVSG